MRKFRKKCREGEREGAVKKGSTLNTRKEDRQVG